MTTLNADIIECLRLGIKCASREAQRLEYNDQSPSFFRMTGDLDADKAIAHQTIQMMERVSQIVGQTIDPNCVTPTDSAVDIGHWLRQRINMLRNNGDVAATAERQRLEQAFELLATAHPVMISDDRKALLAQLETFVDEPASFSPASIEALIKRTIQHLNGSPI